MFSRIQTRHFRCLRSVDQKLGRFATLVGPNASGKTTFLDVLALLGDIMGNGGKIAGPIFERSSDFHKLLWKGEGSAFQVAVEAMLPASVRSAMDEKFAQHDRVRYELEIGLNPETNKIGVNYEVLWLLTPYEEKAEAQLQFPLALEPPETIFLKGGEVRKMLISNIPDRNANYIPDGKSTYQHSFKLDRGSVAMGNIPADRDSFHAAPWFRDLLAEGVQRLILNSQKIREPSPPGLGHGFQPDGSNLPWVITELKKDQRRFEQWLDHVRTALPDIEDVDSIERPEDRHRYLTIRYIGGAQVPSWLVSDGTLRLLALTIPAYLPDFDGVILIEEPENGIHPRAIETVLQSLSSIYDGQVLLATHSPVALNMLEAKDVLCFAKAENGATDIVAGDLHPALKDWKEGEPDFGVLFAAGILS